MNGLWMGLFFALLSVNTWALGWLPEELSPSEIIEHSVITIGYREEYEVPGWVAYVLRREHLQDCYDRGNNFRVDPSVSTGSAHPNDYRQSGYDRGHIAPAGDMKWSKEAMDESFYMSNITPQTAAMNRSRWASLETIVRAWAKEGEETFIVSGPILHPELTRIGQNGVAVPENHFKVLLRIRQGKKSMIGFVMGQNPTGVALETYALPVREIEKMSGLNFFPHLSYREQQDLETKVKWQDWDFGARFTYDPCTW